MAGGGEKLSVLESSSKLTMALTMLSHATLRGGVRRGGSIQSTRALQVRGD